MPNITMCRTESCPIKKICYRYVAEPTPEQQSYAIFLFLKKDDRIFCPHYKSNNYERIETETEEHLLE